MKNAHDQSHGHLKHIIWHSAFPKGSSRYLLTQSELKLEFACWCMMSLLLVYRHDSHITDWGFMLIRDSGRTKSHPLMLYVRSQPSMGSSATAQSQGVRWLYLRVTLCQTHQSFPFNQPRRHPSQNYMTIHWDVKSYSGTISVVRILPSKYNLTTVDDEAHVSRIIWATLNYAPLNIGRKKYKIFLIEWSWYKLDKL